MPKISAVIITYNEEEKIERCIRSVQGVADEVVVVDSNSTDRTGEICKSLGVRFVLQPFLGYREQKNFATSLAENDYILSLDADEALSEELKQSILAVKNDWKFDGYSFNRLNNYCGQWIYHCNWYPDRKIRLFDRRKGAWGGLNLHELVKMQPIATVSFLKGDLLHWVHTSVDEHIEKANRFSTIGAREYFNAGKKATFLSAIHHFFWRFFKSYIVKGGFRDGYYGFVICTISSYTTFLKYMKLRLLIVKEKENQSGKTKENKVNIAS